MSSIPLRLRETAARASWLEHEMPRRARRFNAVEPKEPGGITNSASDVGR